MEANALDARGRDCTEAMAAGSRRPKAYPECPGAMLARELKRWGIGPQEVEASSGLREETLRHVMEGGGRISPDIARALHQAMGADGAYWLRQQALHDAKTMGKALRGDEAAWSPVAFFDTAQIARLGDSPHPGIVLARFLEGRGLTLEELARRMGVPASDLEGVLVQEDDVTPQLAAGLEKALGVACDSWLELQAAHDGARLEAELCAAMTSEELRLVDVLSALVRDMEDRGLLESGDTVQRKVLLLRQRLGVGSLTRLAGMPGCGLHGLWVDAESGVHPAGAGAWARLCERTWHTQPPYRAWDPERVPALVQSLKRLMRQESFYPEEDVPFVLRGFGLACFIDMDFDLGVLGCAAKLSDGTPAVACALKDGYADEFWLCLLREIGHVARGHLDGPSAPHAEDRTAMEAEADRFAWQALLDPRSHAAFVAEGDFSPVAIERHATAQGVPDGPVISRLQRDGHIGPSDLDERREYIEL